MLLLVDLKNELVIFSTIFICLTIDFIDSFVEMFFLSVPTLLNWPYYYQVRVLHKVPKGTSCTFHDSFLTSTMRHAFDGIISSIK